MSNTAHAGLDPTTPVPSSKRNSLTDIAVGFLIIGIVIVIAVKIVIAIFHAATGTSSAPSAPSATSAPSAPARVSRAPTVAQACSGARFTPCFVNTDGQTCRNDLSSPITQLVANGSYTVTSRAVNGAGVCTLTLAVQGSVNGSSYGRTVEVWAYK